MSPRTTWTHYTVNGRNIGPGTEITLKRGGRWRFVERVKVDAGAEWITVYGPVGSARAKLRSFDPDQIKTVHRTRRTR